MADFSDLKVASPHSGKINFSDLSLGPVLTGRLPHESTTALGAAGRGAVGMIPLGEQAYAGIESLVDKTPYLQERQELEKDIESDKAFHPEARLAGQAAGVVAPAILTGGASVPAAAGGALTEGALYGAGFGTGKAIDTLASGGSGAQAAGDVALGTLTGVTGGAAGKALGNVVSKAAKPFVNSQDEILAEATAGILGGNTRQIRNLPGKNPVETLIRMGSDMSKRTVNGEPLVAVTDQMPARLNKFLTLEEQSGKTIGDIIKTADVPPLTTAPIGEEMNAALKFATPDDQAQMKAVLDQVQKYANPDGTISFERLHQLKREIGNRAFEGEGSPALKAAYNVVSDVQERELEKVSSAVNMQAFDDAKNAYWLTSRAIPMLRMSVAKELGAKPSLVVPGAALIAGHPAVAAGALMKNRLGQMGSGAIFKGVQALPEGAGEIAANIPGKIGAQVGGAQNMGAPAVLPHQQPKASPTEHKNDPNSLNLDHPAMAQWKGIFEKNASTAKNPGEIEKSHAVTDFILSQRDPAYAAAKKKMKDEPMTPAAPTAPVAPAAPEPVKMAEGGVVEDKNDPNAMGNLRGLQEIANRIAKKKPVAVAKPQEPVSSDFADKLRAFLEERKNAESR